MSRPKGMLLSDRALLNDGLLDPGWLAFAVTSTTCL